ncbi:hypothetical protein MCAMS1_02820 [biofilm metagenome]
MNKRDNVVEFPTGKKNGAGFDLPRFYTGKVRKERSFMPLNMVYNTLIFLLGVLRGVLFTTLLWVRPLVFLVCRPVCGICLVAFIVCLVLSPDDPRLKYGYGVISFASFMVMMGYDHLLMLLSRGNIVNVLN